MRCAPCCNKSKSDRKDRESEMMGILPRIPFLCIRFLLLAAGGRSAAPRAAHFAPTESRRPFVYWLYQAATTVLLLYPLFLPLRADAVPWPCCSVRLCFPPPYWCSSSPGISSFSPRSSDAFKNLAPTMRST